MSQTDDDHRQALELELLGGMLRQNSNLSLDDWKLVIRRLGPADARVVVLTCIHGMTQDEVAERLYVSRARVFQRWHLAVAKLKKAGVANLL